MDEKSKEYCRMNQEESFLELIDYAYDLGDLTEDDAERYSQEYLKFLDTSEIVISVLDKIGVTQDIWDEYLSLPESR